MSVRDYPFPLQPDRKSKIGPVNIPWSVAEKAYGAYALRFGKDQTLERLAERKGFSWSEMDMFLPGWREECGEIDALKAEIAALKAEVERLKRDGSPGVVHEIDQAFWNVERAERRVEVHERDALRAEVKAIRALFPDDCTDIPLFIQGTRDAKAKLEERVSAQNDVLAHYRAEVERLREIEHAAWHMLDDSAHEDGEITVRQVDFDKLDKLLPEEHPTRDGHDDATQDESETEPGT